MIGAQSSRLRTVDDAIRYIFDEYKTESELQGEQYLSLLQPQQAWHFLDEENHENSRQFIHGMICPGGKQSVVDLMSMMKELCGYYEEYAMLYAVHNDKPSHVHAHFLIHPINIITKKRWQQSPKQFYQLLDFLNGALKQYGFAELAQCRRKRKAEVFQKEKQNDLLSDINDANETILETEIISEKIPVKAISYDTGQQYAFSSNSSMQRNDNMSMGTSIWNPKMVKNGVTSVVRKKEWYKNEKDNI